MVRPGSPACISRVRLLGSEGLVAGCRESLSSCAPSTCPCHGCKPWSPGMFYLRSWQRAPARLPCDSTSPAPSPRRARRAGTLKDDQHCYLCGQNGHRQFECPNRTDDIYKLPTQMQEKVDNLYQRDVARMAGDAAPSGAPARSPAPRCSAELRMVGLCCGGVCHGLVGAMGALSVRVVHGSGVLQSRRLRRARPPGGRAHCSPSDTDRRLPHHPLGKAPRSPPRGHAALRRAVPQRAWPNMSSTWAVPP